MRWWPRTIRWQMLAGLLLLETLSIGLFAGLLVRQLTSEVYMRARTRLLYEATSVALQSSEALLQNRPGWVGLSVKMMGEAPTVTTAKVTDPAGNVLFVSEGDADQTRLELQELAQIPLARNGEPRFFTLPGNRWESVAAIYTNNQLRGYAWVQFDKTWAREQLASILRDTVIFAIIWIVASAVLVLLMARSIYQPLATLQRGTRALMTSPDDSSSFPLRTQVQNEIGELIVAFNRMVASLAEQRSGLNDTLSLLDSMLANAPIGLAFFDSDCRFTRVNKVFADMTGVSLGRHLGRTLPELFPEPKSWQPVAEYIDDCDCSTAGPPDAGEPCAEFCAGAGWKAPSGIHPGDSIYFVMVDRYANGDPIQRCHGGSPAIPRPFMGATCRGSSTTSTTSSGSASRPLALAGLEDAHREVLRSWSLSRLLGRRLHPRWSLASATGALLRSSATNSIAEA